MEFNRSEWEEIHTINDVALDDEICYISGGYEIPTQFGRVTEKSLERNSIKNPRMIWAVWGTRSYPQWISGEYERVVLKKITFKEYSPDQNGDTEEDI